MKSSWTIVSLCAAIAVAATVSFAQPDSLWSRIYGGTGGEESSSVVQTEDGGYVLGCATSSYGAGDWDAWMIKTDADGDTLWCRTFGGWGWDMVSNVDRTTDGGYFIAGTTASYGAGNDDFWLVKTDADGNTQWSRTYGGPADEQLWWGQQTTDGGYILAGFTYSFGAGGRDVWLVKTNANGDTLWSRTFGGPLHDGGTSVVQTADSGYMVAGVGRSFGEPNGDFWLIKTDANGDSVWSHIYGGPRADIPYAMEQTMDGGYIVTGFTTQSNGITDAWLLKTSADGDSLWSLTYGDLGAPDVGLSVVQTSDGGYAVAGGAQWNGGPAVGDAWLIRTDGEGNLLWNRAFGGPAYDMAYDVQRTADGGYAIMGITKSFGAVNQDAWLIKTGPDPVQPVTWTQVDSALHPFVAAGNGVLGNYFYCFGSTLTNPVAQAFNLTTEQWEESTIPPLGWNSFSSAVTGDAIYLIGWYNPGNQQGPEVQKFTPTGGGPTGTWTQMAPYPLSVCVLATAWDGGSHIYAAGGSDANGNAYPDAYKYDIDNNWTQIASMPYSMFWCGGAFVGGEFYVLGGMGFPNNLLEYNPDSNTWAERAAAPREILTATGCTTFNDSLVIVVGGGMNYYLGQPPSDAVQIYNPLTDTWTQDTPLPHAVASNSARFVPPDKVISAGNYQSYSPGVITGETYRGTGFPGGAVAVDPVPRTMPTRYVLSQNYPNPFNPSTTVRFTVPKVSKVTLTVYDILGRRVTTLGEGLYSPGPHEIMWNCPACPTGIYILRMNSEGAVQQRKMLLMK